MGLNAGLLSNIVVGVGKGLVNREKKKNSAEDRQLKRDQAALGEKKFAAQQSAEQRKNDEFAFQRAGDVLQNNNIPDSGKLDYYNNTYVPLSRKLGLNVPTLTVWDPKVKNAVKSVSGIMQDFRGGKINEDEARFGLAAIDDQSKRDFSNSRAAFDTEVEGKFQSDKAKAIGIMRDIQDAGGQMNEEQQKFLKGIRGTKVGEAALREFEKGPGKQQKISKIDLAIRAANVPTDLSQITEDQATAVLQKLKESDAGINDISVLMSRSNKGSGFWSKILEKVFPEKTGETGRPLLPGNDQTSAIPPKTDDRVADLEKFSNRDQETLNNILA
jgi:hypothetical protein